ncbi:hypothetical protein AOLI_G00271690 [Acnodon oligacanthus]
MFVCVCRRTKCQKRSTSTTCWSSRVMRSEHKNYRSCCRPAGTTYRRSSRSCSRSCKASTSRRSFRTRASATPVSTTTPIIMAMSITKATPITSISNKRTRRSSHIPQCTEAERAPPTHGRSHVDTCDVTTVPKNCC